jgi:hypothetical protein
MQTEVSQRENLDQILRFEKQRTFSLTSHKSTNSQAGKPQIMMIRFKNIQKVNSKGLNKELVI